MAAYELKYTAEEIDGILESVDEKTIYGDATQSAHGLMSVEDKSKLDALPTSQQIESSLSGKVDKENGKGLSTNDYDNTAKAKVDAIPADPKYTDTVYDDTALSGRVSTIEGKESGWDAKQDALVSGTNIKTVNGESLLGSGNIEIQGGEENVIEAITMNGASVPVTNKTAEITETDPTVPSWAKQSNKPSYNYSEIGNTPDLSGFITKSVNDLTNYYLKSETYTKDEVAALIGAIQNFHYEFYASTSAVTNPQGNVLYLIGPTGTGSDKYEEYVYSNNDWNKIGDTSIDLSGYVTTSALNTALAGYATTQDLDDSKVFWVEVDVTLFAEIQDAIDAGRTVMLKDEDDYVYGLSSFYRDDLLTFSLIESSEKYIKAWVVYNDDAWNAVDGGTIELQNNRTTSISSSSDNNHYPTAKAVWDIVSTKYTKPQGGIPASDLESGVIPTVPVQDVTVGGTSVVNNGTAVIPAIPDTSDFEASSNKVSTISGNETNTTKYPNTKAVADALGKRGVVSQTQTWSDTGTQPRTYVMSDLVYGTIPQANIDLFESAGATFNATTGYFELNGLNDISYEEMQKIYSIPHLTPNASTWAYLYNNESIKARTIIPMRTNAASSSMSTANIVSMFLSAGAVESIIFNFNSDATKRISINAQGCNYAFSSCVRLRNIEVLVVTSNINNQNFTSTFNKCYSLENIRLSKLGKDVSFAQSSALNLASIVYMVENTVNTTAITITLHADALARCTADTTEYEYNSNTYTGIVALATAKNITLAS